MLNLFRKSISARLALMFTVATVSMALAYAVCLRVTLQESLEKQMHNELQFRYSLVEPMIVSRASAYDWQLLKAKFVNLSTSEGGRVQYWIISDDPFYHLGGPVPQGVNLRALEDGFSKVDLPDAKKCPLFLMASTLPASGNRPALRYVVAIDSTPYMGTLEEFTRVLLFITFFGVIMVALLGYWISRAGMKPIKALSAQSHQLVPGKQKQRLCIDSLPEELHALAEAFNGVLVRQEKAWEQLESFNADVAHELKTPLTNLIGQTQLALSRDRSVEQLQNMLGSNLEELERMSSIINDMLFLSHAQTGKFAAQMAQVSLRNESQKAAEYLEPSLTERHLSVRINGDATAYVDRRLFTRSLANLLSNGSRYAREGSTIDINIVQSERFISVSVLNEGAEIESYHLERLFERFYRVDGSRTQSSSNHGLGLSIVKAIALVHGGDVFVNSRDGVNTFGFTLAVAEKR
ncbi:two-component system heavy metal sensor histidine kinase CusS [Pantoea coffeiphila]|nr:heavy metal sensor histidine kinase [Pantoea coffeiphila]MBM7341364.1 two-component system heavy metal sensor histidine kinase CusS [Pantoea coffeiphila]